jgi:hypothetical protein
MQATLDAASLKRRRTFFLVNSTRPRWTELDLLAFTRAINCLTRYGDELTICAYPDYFSLSTTNSAKTAFCRFKYEKEYFSRYKVGEPRPRSRMEEEDISELKVVKGQLLAKVYPHIIIPSPGLLATAELTVDFEASDRGEICRTMRTINCRRYRWWWWLGWGVRWFGGK